MSLGIFVPGRLGSQRCPSKLLRPLGDTNLWEIACAKLSNLSSTYRSFVLTSDAELIDIASTYDGIELIGRDPETAKADYPTNYVFKDIDQTGCSHLMFLNPCLPFLSENTIRLGLALFDSVDIMEYLTSIKPLNNYIYDNHRKPINLTYECINTKLIEPYWQMAHAFHVFNVQAFLESGQMLRENHGAVLIRDEIETLDVDTEIDFKFVKMMWEEQHAITC